MKVESIFYDGSGRLITRMTVSVPTPPRITVGTLSQGREYPALTTAWDNAEDAAAFDGQDERS